MQQNALDELERTSVDCWPEILAKPFQDSFLLKNIWLQYNTSILIRVSSCDIQLLKVDQ